MRAADSTNTGFRLAAVTGLRNRGRRTAVLRMTAMIDIIFLLLIFFVLTSKFNPPQKYLPLAVAGTNTDTIENLSTEPLRIELETTNSGFKAAFAQNEITINDSAGFTAAHQHYKILAEKLQNCKTNKAAEITSDNDLNWQHLVAVYNILYSAGYSDITFVVND